MNYYGMVWTMKRGPLSMQSSTPTSSAARWLGQHHAARPACPAGSGCMVCCSTKPAVA